MPCHAPPRLFGVLLTVTGFAVHAPSAWTQTMGASSSSTGAVVNPITTTSVGRTTYGTKSLNVVNQAGGVVVPSYSFNLPDLPRATQPEPLFSKPKPFDPDLGPFEPNR